MILADYDNCRVQVFELDGSFVRQWDSFDRPHGIAVSGGEVFLTCSKKIKVFKFNVHSPLLLSRIAN